ncbi:unnamed protein product, partial [Rotaria sp. Silwood2]
RTVSSNIYRLVLEFDEDDNDMQLDFCMLVEQTIPLEFQQ